MTQARSTSEGPPTLTRGSSEDAMTQARSASEGPPTLTGGSSESAMTQARSASEGPHFSPSAPNPACLAAGPPDPAAFIQERIQAGSRRLFSEFMAVAERDLITRVLQHTHEKQLHAARILGSTPRACGPRFVPLESPSGVKPIASTTRCRFRKSPASPIRL